MQHRGGEIEMDMNDYKADDFGVVGVIVGMQLKCGALS
jgi:hypothetical protein